MKLLPSLKQKKRYVVFEIISKKVFSFEEIKEEVDKALLTFLGELGVAKSSPMLIKEKSQNNKFIIKVNHKYTDELKSALILIKRIKNTPVIICSIITSGTIKKAGAYLS
ncbi:MAG: Rpp14/Pop5 family protein [Nanoarchaeota archaeon]